MPNLSSLFNRRGTQMGTVWSYSNLISLICEAEVQRLIKILLPCDFFFFCFHDSKKLQQIAAPRRVCVCVCVCDKQTCLMDALEGEKN